MTRSQKIRFNFQGQWCTSIKVMLQSYTRPCYCTGYVVVLYQVLLLHWLCCSLIPGPTMCNGYVVVLYQVLLLHWLCCSLIPGPAIALVML